MSGTTIRPLTPQQQVLRATVPLALPQTQLLTPQQQVQLLTPQQQVVRATVPLTLPQTQLLTQQQDLVQSWLRPELRPVPTPGPAQVDTTATMAATRERLGASR